MMNETSKQTKSRMVISPASDRMVIQLYLLAVRVRLVQWRVHWLLQLQKCWVGKLIVAERETLPSI